MAKDQPVVLVVDDDLETTRIFSYFLDKRGYKTLMAGTVADALAHIEQERPDIVLLDIMLPKQNGTELLKHIRYTPELADIYVIIVSAHTLEENTLPTGVLPDDTLRKPIRIPLLEAALDKALA